MPISGVMSRSAKPALKAGSSARAAVSDNRPMRRARAAVRCVIVDRLVRDFPSTLDEATADPLSDQPRGRNDRPVLVPSPPVGVRTGDIADRCPGTWLTHRGNMAT